MRLRVLLVGLLVAALIRCAAVSSPVDGGNAGSGGSGGSGGTGGGATGGATGGGTGGGGTGCGGSGGGYCAGEFEGVGCNGIGAVCGFVPNGPGGYVHNKISVAPPPAPQGGPRPAGTYYLSSATTHVADGGSLPLGFTQQATLVVTDAGLNAFSKTHMLRGAGNWCTTERENGLLVFDGGLEVLYVPSCRTGLSSVWTDGGSLGYSSTASEFTLILPEPAEGRTRVHKYLRF